MDRARHLTTESADPVPLVVDLDGTLARNDTLVESLFALARRQPWRLLTLPLWLTRGRAAFKQHVAALAPLDVHHLPFAEDLMASLREQQRRGRRLVLASGADERIARGVAGELGLFDAVLAIDGVVNLSGEAKRDRLGAAFGARGFDYGGNSARDLPAWAAARRAWLVRTPPRVAAAAAGTTVVERAWLKRYAELVVLRARHGAQTRVRGCGVGDAALIGGLGMASGCTAVAVLALYPVV